MVLSHIGGRLLSSLFAQSRGHATDAAASPRLCRGDTEPHGNFSVTVKVDVIDTHFAGFDTIHYLLKVFVFDLQSVTDQ